MYGANGQIADRRAQRESGYGDGQPATWSLTATAEPQRDSDFEALLLAIAAHDLRQPLQILKIAHGGLGAGRRTKAELRLLEMGQSAIDRLTEQLNQLVGALLLHEQAKAMEQSPVRVDPLLRRACRDYEEIASRDRIGIRIVPTEASVMSNALLLGVVLSNLVSNAVKYTQPGGRILLGCRRSDQNVRIDVFDTGNGIAGKHIPKLFEAFTRFDFTKHDGLGIGLFIVRQAIMILGHRIEVSSVACRGSRFSIFARGGK